jgi:hypothetical protein
MYMCICICVYVKYVYVYMIFWGLYIYSYIHTHTGHLMLCGHAVLMGAISSSSDIIAGVVVCVVL